MTMLNIVGHTTIAGCNVRVGNSVFTPAALFSAGEQGVWYDPSDMDYLNALGSELVTNGGFDSATWWGTDASWSISGGVATVTGNDQLYSPTGVVPTGKWYKATFDVTNVTTAGNLYVILTQGTNNIIPISSSGTGTYSVIGSGMSDGRIRFGSGSGSSFRGSIDNVSVKELTDISSATMYQNSTGTTPVTGLEQPVGLILDKSQGLVLGTEIVDYSSWGVTDSSWSVGVNSISAVNGINYGAYQLGALTSGKSYKVTLTVTSYTAGTVRVRLNTLDVGIALSGLGTQTAIGISNGPALYLMGNGTFTGTVTISVKELPGNHAVAANNGTARPILRARYNLLTYSEEFDNGAWVKTNSTITANATTAPDGTTTADKLVEASDSAVLHSTNSANFALIGGQYTFSIYAKASERNWLLLNLTPASGVYSSSDARAWFDLSNGTVGTVGGTGATASIAAVGNGWYRCVLVGNYVVLSNRRSLAATATADGSSSNDGDGTSGVYIWGAQLVANSVFPSNVYQRIAAATDYATGADFPPYLAFTTDDAMSTASINFSGTDEMSVFAGVTKNVSNNGMITELSTDSATNNGAFYMYGFSDSKVYYQSTGTSAKQSSTAALSYPKTFVCTGLSDISNDIANIRLDGQLVGTQSGDQGTGNYGNYALYIGARNNSSFFFNGSLYSLIVRGKTTLPSEITATEAWVAGKTGVTL